MKIFVGIPTRRRSTAGSVAKVMEPFADSMVIASQKSTISYVPHNAQVIELEERGICYPRNFLTDMAFRSNCDWMFQVDDDLSFSADVIQLMIRVMESGFDLGAVSSDSRVLAHWSQDLKTNTPFKISGVASQLWAVNMKAMTDIAKEFDDEPPFHIDALEDIRWSMKLWSCGWPIVRIHAGERMTHNPLVARIGKGDSGGGQLVSERSASMIRAIEDMQIFVGGPLRFINHKTDKAGNPGYRIGYDYSYMCRKAVERFGNQGYEDNKGRSF